MIEQTMYIRTALMPLCYKEFHCLMGACQDNCCGGSWLIGFNESDYLRIRNADKSRELEELLAQGMAPFQEKAPCGFYARFIPDGEGRCRLQTENGLCRLQMECGEDTLPYVCKIYPRKIKYTPAALEYSLSPSCEGVLALLWDLPQGIDFWEEPLPKKNWKKITTWLAASRFPEIRSLWIDVLQNRSLRMPQRLILLGLMLQELMERDWDRTETFDSWLAWGEGLLNSASVTGSLEGLPQNQGEFLTANLRILVELYRSDPAGHGVFCELMDAVSADENWDIAKSSKFTIDGIRYQEMERRLDGLMGHEECFFENLMVLTSFYLTYPDMQSPEALWKSYVSLCSLYSFYRFAAVCGCHKETSRERLFRVLVYASRGLLHNEGRRDLLRDELFGNSSATLAHMAILVNS